MTSAREEELVRRLEQAEGELAELARLAASDRRVADLEAKVDGVRDLVQGRLDRLEGEVRDLRRNGAHP